MKHSSFWVVTSFQNHDPQDNWNVNLFNHQVRILDATEKWLTLKCTCIGQILLLDIMRYYIVILPNLPENMYLCAASQHSVIYITSTVNWIYIYIYDKTQKIRLNKRGRRHSNQINFFTLSVSASKKCKKQREA